MRKVFRNNNWWPGITCIMYQVPLDEFVQEILLEDYYSITEEKNIPITEYIITKDISEIGIQYKSVDETDWHTIKFDTEYGNILEKENQGYPFKTEGMSGYSMKYRSDFPAIGRDFYYEVSEEDYAWDVTSRRVFVVLKNLEPNKEYQIKTYYVSEEGTTVDGQIKVSTKQDNGNRIKYHDDIIIDSSLSYSEEKKEEQIQKFKDKVQPVLDMINSVVTFNQDYVFTVQIGGANGAADYDKQSRHMRVNPGSIDFGTILHELSHGGLLLQGGTNIQVLQRSDLNGFVVKQVMKYQEFCTNVPGAIWKWQGPYSAHLWPYGIGEHTGTRAYRVCGAWTVLTAKSLTQEEQSIDVVPILFEEN